MSAIFLLIICFFCNQKDTEILNTKSIVGFEQAISVGIVQDSGLEEASGIVASRYNPGLFWVINDSGNKPELFLINNNAEIVHLYQLKDIENIDWEDLTIFEDNATRSQKLVIGDIGDNFAVRDSISLIILDEPQFSDMSDTLISDFKVCYFKYKDGPRDAETIICDPITSRIYIISKREENVMLFEVPENLSSAHTRELNLVTRLPFNNMTSGDISMDGSEILLKTYDSIYYWKRNVNGLLIDELSNDYQSINYKIEPQGESICWDVDGTGFYTLSEKSWSNEQVLYYYKKKYTKQ